MQEKIQKKKDNLGFDFVVKTTLAFGLAGKVGIDLLAKIRSSNNKSKNKSNENPVSIKSEGDAATKRREELEKRKIERIKKEERAQKNQQIETGQPEGDKTNVSSQEAWDYLRQARHHEPPVSQSTTSTQSVSVTPEDSQSLTSVSEKGNSNITP